MEQLRKSVIEVLLSTGEKVKPHVEENGLVSNGILDSLDIMNLIMELEATFDIEIEPEDVLSENFESADKIAELVKKCQG